MKILVFSDSHGRADAMERALRAHPDAECILHAGDGVREFEALCAANSTRTCAFVYGNAEDFWGRAPDSAVRVMLDLDGTRLMLVHGHRFGVKSSTAALEEYARSRGADIAVFGHTHEPLERRIPEADGRPALTLFNPGSISHPREGKPSYGIIEIYDRRILTSHAYIEY